MKQALRAAIFAAFAVVLSGSALVAQDRVTLGHARMFNNDAMGDARDRWRTGSYFVSRLRAPEWTETLPTRFGEVLEWRARTEIVAPADLTRNNPADRRYAGVLGFGAHTHFALGRAEASVGAEMVITGPQTGIGAFQREIHELLDMQRPNVLGTQIGNGFHPTLHAELGRSFALGNAISLRPFVQAQAGIETFVRVGGDVVIGHWGQSGLMVRDTVTGQRTEGIAGTDGKGVSFTMGGDIARMFDSELLPAGGVEMSESRARLRAGVNWQGEKSEVFYGVTWLGKEYETQPDEQLVGSLRLRLRF